MLVTNLQMLVLAVDESSPGILGYRASDRGQHYRHDA